MPKTLLLEEYHVAIRAPTGLREKDYRAILRALRSQSFQKRLGRAVRDVIARHPSLKSVSMTLGR